MKTSFQAKYIVQLINAVVVNTWRCKQKFEIRQALKTKELSIPQIRRNAQELTTQDFTYSLAVNLLRALQLEKSMPGPPVAQIGMHMNDVTDRKLIHVINRWKANNKWPLKRNRVA